MLREVMQQTFEELMQTWGGGEVLPSATTTSGATSNTVATSVLDPETHPQLRKIQAISDNLYGVPLNFPDDGSEYSKYLEDSSENPIVQAVLNTGLHENENPNVKFARAVYIHPYLHKIHSIWVYVAAIDAKDIGY
eukprot:TRINITY_DN6413_c0_g1_i7.p1 TRINITY_DN6413_c0_g1~~TRINITY_DN6413_c0_g1_i7.p1  ORF type:complete len:136 (+),score=24.28 TRINITY_DN6413_c0_g1_i7:426-833(+)